MNFVRCWTFLESAEANEKKLLELGHSQSLSFDSQFTLAECKENEKFLIRSCLIITNTSTFKMNDFFYQFTGISGLKNQHTSQHPYHGLAIIKCKMIINNPKVAIEAPKIILITTRLIIKIPTLTKS